MIEVKTFVGPVLCEKCHAPLLLSSKTNYEHCVNCEHKYTGQNGITDNNYYGGYKEGLRLGLTISAFTILLFAMISYYVFIS